MPTPRSLAEELRGRSDEDIVQLMQSRPDLLRPVPKSFADLALRANTAASTLRAMSDSTAAELGVLEAACALASAGRFSSDDIAHGLGQPGGSTVVSDVVQALLSRALLWGSRADIRVPSAVREAMGKTPCGLDPVERCHAAGIAALRADSASFDHKLAAAPEALREALVELAWQPRSLRRDRDSDASIIRWLAVNDLLATDDTGEPVLPRAVALAVRQGLLIRDAELEPALPESDIAIPEPEQILVDAGHAADQLIRSMDRVMGFCAVTPIARQTNGSIRSRDWQDAAAMTEADSSELALLLALAWHAIWIDDDGSRHVRTTIQFEEAGLLSREERWSTLVQTWLELPSCPSLDGAEVLKAKNIPEMPLLRRQILKAVESAPLTEIGAWLAWYRPRRSVSAETLLATLAEARTLGLITVGGPAPTIAELLSEPPEQQVLADTIRTALPEQSTDLILQADLTATALGPLPRDMEQRLSRAADWESTGAAAVFRFTPDSIRRALATGEDPADLQSWLTENAKTPVPQALNVLIEDSAKQRASMAVSDVTSVLSCDPATAASLMAAPELSDIGFIELAPGVLGSQLSSEELALRMRQLGHFVADAVGIGVPINSERSVTKPNLKIATSTHRVINSLRRVEEKIHPELHPPEQLASLAPHELRAALNSASLSHHPLWLRFSDEAGNALTHLVEPLSLDDGEICAYDLTSNEIRVVPIARVTSATSASD